MTDMTEKVARLAVEMRAYAERLADVEPEHGSALHDFTDRLDELLALLGDGEPVGRIIGVRGDKEPIVRWLKLPLPSPASLYLAPQREPISKRECPRCHKAEVRKWCPDCHYRWGFGTGETVHPTHREPGEWQEACAEINMGGIYDEFTDPADAIRQLGQYIREAEEALPEDGLIGESLAGRITALAAHREPGEAVADESHLPTLRSLMGMAPDVTGTESPEDFVKDLRAAWSGPPTHQEPDDE